MTKNTYTNVQVGLGKILYRGFDGQGRRINKRVDFQPTLYTDQQSDEFSGFQDIHGVPVAPKTFPSITEAKNFCKRYSDVSGFTIYGNQRFEYQYIQQNMADHIEWNIDDLLICNIDIEVKSDAGFPEPEKAERPVTAITMDFFDRIVVIGFDEYETMAKFKTTNLEVEYHECNSEIQLLQTFLSIWSGDYPDIVTGWNIKFFDIPYLYNRLTNLFGEETARLLSPWKNAWKRHVDLGMGRAATAVNLTGIAQLDYLDLYQRYAPNGKSQPSYKLDAIGEVELGMKKLDYSEAASLHALYKTNFQKYLDYNIQDTNIIRGLEAKLKLIEMAVTLAYDSKCNFDDVFAQVRMWDVLTTNYLLNDNIVSPPVSRSSKNEKYEGAYVKDPQIGMHNYVASFDLDSLYPHGIMGSNISPDTFIEPHDWTPEMSKLAGMMGVGPMLHKDLDTHFLKDQNVTVTPNGHFFDTSRQGFLAAMMEEMYTDRKAYKGKMIEAKRELETAKRDGADTKDIENRIARYNNLQLAKKVCLNSAYGALGNQYFRFFDIRLAVAITTTAQLAIQWVANDMNKSLNDMLKTDGDYDYIAYSDTDSMYILMEPLLNKLGVKDNHIEKMDKLCAGPISNIITKSFDELAEYTNAYEQKMSMKREILADKAIWTAKKRYILNVCDDEGVRLNEPKIKITGLEAIKSSTPEACRPKIKDAIKIMMNGDNDQLITFIDKFREEFRTLDEDMISFPRGVNNLKQYSDKLTTWSKGTPIHVRGALVYNQILKQKNLTNEWESIKEGEKLKFVYLKEPNPFHSNIISFSTLLPPEIDAHEYIDYDTQFDKSFVQPLKIVLDAIGWHLEKVASFDDLWA